MEIADQIGNSELLGPHSATSALVPRRATGPRTRQGKQKSKHNALKHGIFSRVVLLKEEPRTEFYSLLSSLQKDLQPKGSLEELLVDKLAAIVWRKRRLLVAEGAEIRKGNEFVDSDIQRRTNEKEADIVQAGFPLVRHTENARILNTCITTLEILKEWTEEESIDEKTAECMGRMIYGDGPSTPLMFLLQYLRTQNVAHSEITVGREIDLADLGKYKHIVLDLLDEEIRRFKLLQCGQILEESMRIEIECSRANVPYTPQSDRLLRYEASLERAFDRTLSQLERRQQLRLGQALPPTLNVSLST